MDELKDKFKNLLKPAKKFQGQGHKLGTADAKPAPAKPQARPAVGPSQSAHGSSQPAAVSQHPSAAAGQQQTAAAHNSSNLQQLRSDPRQELRPATEFSPFTAVIGGGAARTTNSMNPTNITADSHSSSSLQGTGRRLGSAQPPPQQQQQQTPALFPSVRADVSPAVLEELQHCLALVSSQQQVAVSSMQVLHKLLSNLITAPQEAKFRQLRLGPDPNPKIQAAVLDVSGALDFLKTCGFEVHADEPDSQDAGTFAYFLDDAKLSHVEAGLMQLQLALQAAQGAQQQQPGPQQGPPSPATPAAAAAAGQPSKPTSSPAAASPAAGTATGVAAAAAPPAPTPAAAAVPQVVSRNTLVLLPAAPDTDVPEWFFERTAAEVKSEFMALLRTRQTKEVFASKAWKDLKLGTSSSRQPSVITLRVRFPEGVCLQGCFGVREPVSSIFDWVTGSLRHPGLTYELITPSRAPLGPQGLVGGADLAGAVLNFRGLSHTQRGYLVGEGGRQLPFLSDDLLAQAQAD